KARAVRVAGPREVHEVLRYLVGESFLARIAAHLLDRASARESARGAQVVEDVRDLTRMRRAEVWASFVVKGVVGEEVQPRTFADLGLLLGEQPHVPGQRVAERLRRLRLGFLVGCGGV